MRVVFTLLLTLSALAAISRAQQPILEYLETPMEEWRVSFLSVGHRNGVFASPNGKIVVAISETGVVKAFDPIFGDDVWTHIPEMIGEGSLRSQSGVTFNYLADTPFLTFAATEESEGNLTCRIFVLDPEDGSTVFETEPIVGECAGSPQTSRLGRYLFVTHNDDYEGYFSVFDTALATSSVALSPIYQYNNGGNPFSPLGFFHNPIEGYYDSETDAGVNNRNDIFVWGFDTNTEMGADTQAGTGQMFAFQFPIGYNPDVDGVDSLSVVELGSERNYQATTQPVLANNGLNLYWATTRAEQRCWVGETELNRRRFSRSDSNKVGLSRRSGGFPWMAAQAPPTLSSDPIEPVVYGPGASNEFYRFNFDYTEQIAVTTDSFISSRAVVTPDDRYVFYGSEGGFLYQADGSDLSTVWNSSDTSGVDFNGIFGDLAIHPRGTHVYVGDNSRFGTGDVVAIRIANIIGGMEEPTVGFGFGSGAQDDTASDFPSDFPSDSPSDIPTIAPVESATDFELINISFLPQLPTGSPTEAATLMPTSNVLDKSESGNGTSIASTNAGSIRTKSPILVNAPTIAPSISMGPSFAPTISVTHGNSSAKIGTVVTAVKGASSSGGRGGNSPTLYPTGSLVDLAQRSAVSGAINFDTTAIGLAISAIACLFTALLM